MKSGPFSITGRQKTSKTGTCIKKYPFFLTFSAMTPVNGYQIGKPVGGAANQTPRRLIGERQIQLAGQRNSDQFRRRRLSPQGHVRYAVIIGNNW